MAAARPDLSKERLYHRDAHSCPPNPLISHPSPCFGTNSRKNSPKLQMYRPLHPPRRDIIIVEQHIGEGGQAEKNYARCREDGGA